MKSFSLQQKFFCIFLLLACLNSTGALLLYDGVSSQKTDAAVINLAGAQRMLSQQITKEVLITEQGGNPAALIQLLTRFERVLEGLRRGDQKLRLLPCADAEINKELAAAEALWSPFKAAAMKIVEKPSEAQNEKAFILANNQALLVQMDRVVKLLQQRAEAKVSRLLGLQLEHF